MLINGKKSTITHYKKIVGFVPQEDTVHRNMTVKENFEFSARTRLPRKMKAAEISKRVDAVINVLGLENVKYSLIGDETKRGISGGQRKRVNVGVELVSAPSVLFLDERKNSFYYFILYFWFPKKKKKSNNPFRLGIETFISILKQQPPD